MVGVSALFQRFEPGVSADGHLGVSVVGVSVVSERGLRWSKRYPQGGVYLLFWTPRGIRQGGYIIRLNSLKLVET